MFVVCWVVYEGFREGGCFIFVFSFFSVLGWGCVGDVSLGIVILLSGDG